MDLITEPWLPVITRSGIRKKIAIVDCLDDDILDIAYRRADFQGAAWQFLIGLLQCCVAPEEGAAWAETWQVGINPQAWQRGLQVIAPAMQFGAAKPAFLQSYEPLEVENSPVSGLLIDAPGGNTLRLNKDHFVKRHSCHRICPHCAIMALFTLQTNSPAGGAGYRVSLRGGGPLTTLLMPQEENRFPLWQKIWLNVLPDKSQPVLTPEIFPWLAPTFTSEKSGHKVTPENADRRQAYWGMPRRIELDFTQTEAGHCDLCGEPHPALLVAMRTKNYGVQYEHWLHPLSPYRQSLKEPDAPLLALKGQAGGLHYKDWLGLALETTDHFNRMLPAQVTRNLARYRSLPALELWCFAWDMDNAKARCWYQQRLPLICRLDNEKSRELIPRLVMFATAGLQLLRNQLKEARFRIPKDATMDFSTVDFTFWQATEPAFRSLLARLQADPACQQTVTRQALLTWEASLHGCLLTMFDRNGLGDADSPDDLLLRQISARQKFEKDYSRIRLRKEILAMADAPEESEHV